MSHIYYTVTDRIANITLNRPEKRNALNQQLVRELKDALDEAIEQDTVKAIVLRGQGEAFCAGADLAYLQQLQEFTHEENIADSRHLKELFLKMYTSPKVIVAQIEGHALAGGCGLASICDFSFAVPEAKFGYTEVKIGFIPAIVMIFLLRKLGEGKARQLLLSGELIAAEEARQLGLINFVSANESIAKDVENFVTKLITSNSPQSMAATKQMIATAQSLPLEQALEYACEMNARARSSEDCKRGISAFLNKEKIIW
jgi:methylglutaconyl-CoA hydratase